MYERNFHTTEKLKWWESPANTPYKPQYTYQKKVGKILQIVPKSALKFIIAHQLLWIRPFQELYPALKSYLCDTHVGSGSLALRLWSTEGKKYASFFISAMVDEYEMPAAALGLSSTIAWQNVVFWTAEHQRLRKRQPPISDRKNYCGFGMQKTDLIGLLYHFHKDFIIQTGK